jgi:hypothetical protein
MATKVGRDLLRDVLAETGSDAAATRCCRYTIEQLETLRERALARDGQSFDIDEAIDVLIAPICYHILFSDRELSPSYVLSLLERFGNLRNAALKMRL